jgi:hypothetical protein
MSFFVQVECSSGWKVNYTSSGAGGLSGLQRLAPNFFKTLVRSIRFLD